MASVTVKFNKNDGTGSTYSETYTTGSSNNAFGMKLSASVRTGQFGNWDRYHYRLLGWSESSTATSATYNPYNSVVDWWINNHSGQTVNLYAVWTKANTAHLAYSRGGGAHSNTYFTINEYDYFVAVDNRSEPYFHHIRQGVSIDSYNPYNTATFGLSKEGYHFNSQTWRIDGTSTYVNEDTNYDISTYVDSSSPSKNATNTVDVYCRLLPNWIPNVLYLSYAVNGGYLTNSNYSINQYGYVQIASTSDAYFDKRSYTGDYIAPMKATSFGLVKTGHTFVGWDVKKGSETYGLCLNGSYHPIVFTDNQQPDRNILNSAETYCHLIPVWAINGYSVDYNANGGTSTPSSQSGLYNSNITLAGAITRNPTDSTQTITITYNANGGSGAPSVSTGTAVNTTPYTFNKWALNSPSGTKYSAGGTFTIPASNSVMYATWTPGTTTRKSNPSIALSSTIPIREGYRFLGWSTSSTATSATYQAGTVYTFSEDTTLYAVWKPIGSTIYYKHNNEWKKSSLYVKHENEWRESNICVKQSGSWRP